ncbi:MAG: DUF86 domain-containing protein [Chloroflexota bacterium]
MNDLKINNVIIKKLQALDEVVLELRSLGQVTVEQLDKDWRLRRAIERSLQILVEVVIDVSQRLISIKGQTPANSGTEAISRCVKMGILSDEEPYRKMIQFRNFIVHRYEKVDSAIVVDLVNKRLPDFEHFRTEVLNYVQR